MQLPQQKSGLRISKRATSILIGLKLVKGKSFAFFLSCFRCFVDVVKLIYQHAATIEREKVILFFRHSILHLYEYLNFTQL